MGVAAESMAPDGKVSLHGEFWNATSDQSVEKGEKVQVIGVTNLKLKVKKIE
jgi:membrane-bound serine protease (ClpP class)